MFRLGMLVGTLLTWLLMASCHPCNAGHVGAMLYMKCGF